MAKSHKTCMEQAEIIDMFGTYQLPIRKLIGGVRESHTKEYLFQISAQTMGCRERSKFRVQAQQERETRARTRTFEKKERERKKREQPGVPVGPKRLCGAAYPLTAPTRRLGPTRPPGWHLFFLSLSLSFSPKTDVLALVSCSCCSWTPESRSLSIAYCLS